MNPSQIETNKFLLKYKAYNGLFTIGDYIQSLLQQFLLKVDISIKSRRTTVKMELC